MQSDNPYPPDIDMLEATLYAGDDSPYTRYVAPRGISEATARKFRLGYDDRPVSKFYRRVTFPVLDLPGTYVGMQGRAIDDDQRPKYWHSPFSKEEVLYGFWENSLAIATGKPVVMVEGNYDVLSFAEIGVPAVCTMGISVAKLHVAALRMFCETAYVCFDADAAGKRAATTLQKHASKLGLRAIPLSLPYGCKDVNDALCTFGKDALNQWWECMTEGTV